MSLPMGRRMAKRAFGRRGGGRRENAGTLPLYARALCTDCSVQLDVVILFAQLSQLAAI
jgi:hypothetical protein